MTDRVRLLTPRYVLAVLDLERSARYYRDVLGFEDRFYEEVRAKGATLIKPLRNEPWNMREFGIRTADGPASCSDTV